MKPGISADLPAQQRKIIRAWCIYDWANSAYATSGGAAIFPVYFVFLFKDALGETVNLWGFALTSSSTWSLAIALATVLVAGSSPVLGIIADRVAIKKTLLWIYTTAGALFTGLMFLSAYTGQPWLWFLGMFVLANIGFAGSLVFYNAFLPHIAPREELDAVSSRGFTYGYIGGGLLLLAHLALIVTTSGSQYADLATRIAIVSIGVWWFGWAWWTLLVVPEPHIPDALPGLRPGRAVSLAFRELGKTFRELRRFRIIGAYLIAYLLFNDGIQTVLVIAGAFAADTLGIPLVFNMATILIIQFVAAGGSMAFAWLAGRIATKGALLVALAGWVFIILFGVAVAPLAPDRYQDFDYRLRYQTEAEAYLVEGAPELADSRQSQAWREELDRSGVIPTPIASFGPSKSGAFLAAGDEVSAEGAGRLLELVRFSDNSSYGAAISGGPLAGETAVGRRHPAMLGDGPIDWWPETVRRWVWDPLGLDVEYQWLLLGVGVGLVMGGSQALARSLFAQIVPHTRSGEFFSFFGFMGRVSSVVGPILYVVATGFYDSRVAVASIMLLIIAGAAVLGRVNVAAGAQVADAEDRRHYAAANATMPGPEADVARH